jgi:tetratricopeptide (TPR) repeat protein
MFPRQNLAALIHALTVAAMPFSTVIGLVLFGMLTAPPSQQKSPETVSEMFSAAETKALQGKYEEALDLYNQIITKSPKSGALASAYWGRGATYFNQFTRVNTKVRSLKLKTRSDQSFAHEYQATQQAAQTLFNRGMSDHLKAAEIADSAGLTDCSREIRELLPQLQKGMVRYNNSYSIYLKKTLPRC